MRQYSGHYAKAFSLEEREIWLDSGNIRHLFTDLFSMDQNIDRPVFPKFEAP